jgi:UDP-N-acetyl-D-galactosamine dehydrogenase
MGKFIAEQTIKQMIRNGNPMKQARVNVLGLTFKEDVPDLRNSHVVDVINELKSFGVQVFVHDPVPDPEGARHEYGLELVPWEKLPVADAMVVAVAHRQFRTIGVEMFAHKIVKGGCFIDVKSQFDREALAAAGLCVWRL